MCGHSAREIHFENLKDTLELKVGILNQICMVKRGCRDLTSERVNFAEEYHAIDSLYTW